MALTSEDPRDDEVMRRVAAGSADALGVLHRRFARLIFAIAVRSLDRAAAEDLVQDVFLAVWRNAGRQRTTIAPIAVPSWTRQQVVADDEAGKGRTAQHHPGMLIHGVAGLGEGTLERILAAHPMGRYGDPLTDIAPVVIFLASDGARYMTGRTLFADGGNSSYM